MSVHSGPACLSQILFALLAALLLTPPSARPQSCPTQTSNGPSQESESLTLRGLVVYHDALRQWFGLRLDTPTCGQSEVQLLNSSGRAFEVDVGNAEGLETFRGCQATVSGPLGIPGTGYYSAEIYQSVTMIAPDRSCIRQHPFSDFSHVKPSPRVSRYRVTIALSHRGEGSIRVHVNTANLPLTPWQAYASYQLTGGFALYGECAKEFRLSRVSGSPEAKPWQMEDQALSDPETAADKKIEPVLLAFTCSRQRRLRNRSSSQ